MRVMSALGRLRQDRPAASRVIWLARLVAIAGLCCAAGASRAQSVDVYVSSVAGDRLTRKPALQFKAAQSQPSDFQIDDASQFQEIIGFGASFLEAGLITLNHLPGAQQERVLRSLFDARSGAGFSAMKTVIAATDFMSAGPFYSYDDVPGDVGLEHFSIQRDLGPNGLVTFIKRAGRYGTFVLQAPMDYPPDWMLFDAKSHQDVDPKYYAVLARYYLRYVQEYERQGITINYLSPFNEPGNYTKISYAEIRDLLKNHVGPLFERSNLKTRLQASDDPTRSGARTNLPVILEDPDARQYLSILSYHGYDFCCQGDKPTTADQEREAFAGIAELHRQYPSLPLWMTELCYAGAGYGIKPRVQPIPYYGFEDGDYWGHQIMADLENGASAWTYWNMILDETGGPWLVDEAKGNPPNNSQQPLVIINKKTKQVSYTGAYYYLAHFSKFVRPGSHLLKTVGAEDGIRVMSFKRSDGTIVAEIINSRSAAASIMLGWGHRVVGVALPAASISTYLWNGSAR
jgi:glucosylceramidase